MLKAEISSPIMLPKDLYSKTFSMLNLSWFPSDIVSIQSWPAIEIWQHTGVVY